MAEIMETLRYMDTNCQIIDKHTYLDLYSHPKISFALSFYLHLLLIALKGNVKQKVKEMRWDG